MTTINEKNKKMCPCGKFVNVKNLKRHILTKYHTSRTTKKINFFNYCYTCNTNVNILESRGLQKHLKSIQHQQHCLKNLNSTEDEQYIKVKNEYINIVIKNDVKELVKKVLIKEISNIVVDYIDNSYNVVIITKNAKQKIKEELKKDKYYDLFKKLKDAAFFINADHYNGVTFYDIKKAFQDFRAKIINNYFYYFSNYLNYDKTFNFFNYPLTLMKNIEIQLFYIQFCQYLNEILEIS